MPKDATAERRRKALKDAMKLLGEFDTIQILGTVQDGGDTFSYADGFGNLFARRGQAAEWLDCPVAEMPDGTIHEIGFGSDDDE